ncbi:MAG: biotin/lipoyl attachment protein [Gammaproteobacteria bacterium]|jgi:sugar O-acyltransferase (sialic acid O-acetyltransferase NeuD family)|nr:biotin/lipoyl attachment protein [Gammaproteobacteria bacterium]
MQEPKRIVIPQLGVNDKSAKVISWLIADETMIKANDPICEIETTKINMTIHSDYAGFLGHLCQEGDELEIAQPLAVVCESKVELEDFRKQQAQFHANEKHMATNQSITEKAKKLAIELGVDTSKISTEGLIREQDVRAFYEQSQFKEMPAISSLKWPKDKVPVVIYGAGQGGVAVKEALHLDHKYYVVAFVDDGVAGFTEQAGNLVYSSNYLLELFQAGIKSAAIAIASYQAKKSVFHKLHDIGLEVINIIHPKSYIAPSVTIGAGNYIKAGAIIDTYTKIGNLCIIDNGAVIAHDNFIEDGCHIAPGACLGSNIKVGEGSIIGIGASIATRVTIGKNSVVAVGSAVIADLPEHSFVDGVPAKVVGTRK